MKPKIKINFMYYETPFDLKKNWIYKFLENKYEIEISDNPSYVFFSTYKEKNKFLLPDGTVPDFSKETKINILKEIYRNLLKMNWMKSTMWYLREKGIVRPYAQMLDLKGPFVKIFYTCESIDPDMTKCDWAFGLSYENIINHPRYMRVPPYLQFGYNFELMKRNIIQKTKFCNFIYNNHVPFRNNFFKKINAYKQVNSPGKCMQNEPPIAHGETDESRRSNNWEIEKMNYIKPYKFTIACENKIKDGYSTDRIIQSYIAGSIPIYIGDNKIANDFNSKCFINANNRNINEVLDEIKLLDENDNLYNEILNQPILHNKALIHGLRIEKRFEEIFQ